MENTAPLQVTESYGSDDPTLDSLQRYAELARKHDLIEHPIKVDRNKDEGVARVEIICKFGGQRFEYDSVAEAVHFLALIYHAADHAVENS